MYSGITPSCVGTMAVPSTTRNSESRPLNRSRANANPARVPSTTFEIATVAATMNEFCIASQKSTVSKTRVTFSTKLPPGISGGVFSPSTELSFDATTNE